MVVLGYTSNYLIFSRVAEFVKDSQEASSFDQLRETFYSSYGEYPSQEEFKAWASSLRYLASVLNQPDFHDLFIVTEYQLPFSGERIDAAVLGLNRNGRPLVVIIEMKGWRRASMISRDLVQTDIGRQVHPEYQLQNYVGKIRFSHSASADFDLSGFVLMYNMAREASRIAFHEHVFFKGDETQLAQFLRDSFAGPIDQAVANRFINGTYKQSRKLFEAIKQYFDQISQASYSALAADGYGLSAEQLVIVDQIIEELEAGKKSTYLVKGGPGSGKTLVAIHLLLRSLSSGKQSVLTYRNNRLLASLRIILNSSKPGLDIPIKFYSTGKPFNPGIAEAKFEGHFDLVIYDEAQRMSGENIQIAMTRGDTLVFLYDEDQILNSGERDNPKLPQRGSKPRGKLPATAASGVLQSTRRQGVS